MGTGRAEMVTVTSVLWHYLVRAASVKGRDAGRPAGPGGPSSQMPSGTFSAPGHRSVSVRGPQSGGIPQGGLARWAAGWWLGWAGGQRGPRTKPPGLSPSLFQQHQPLGVPNPGPRTRQPLPRESVLRVQTGELPEPLPLSWAKGPACQLRARGVQSVWGMFQRYPRHCLPTPPRLLLTHVPAAGQGPVHRAWAGRPP